MQPIPQGHARSLRLAGVLLALLVLLVVVALASRTGFGHTSPSAAPTPSYVSWAMSVFLILFVVMTPFAVYTYLIQLREVRTSRSQKSFRARMLRGLGIMFLVYGLGAVAFWFRSKYDLTIFRSALPSALAGHHDPKAHGADTYRPTFQYPVLYASLVLGAVGSVLVWRVQRRRSANALLLAAGEPQIVDDVAASIDDAIDDLESEPDARRAVIAAYARMERAFGRHGLARQISETPVEYLRRILLGLTSQVDAVQRLTSLFEQAKFSTHEIDDAMKDEAIGALRSIRDDLTARHA